MNSHSHRRRGGAVRLRGGRGAVRIMLIGDWPGMGLIAPFSTGNGAATARARIRLILNFASDYIAKRSSTFEVR